MFFKFQRKTAMVAVLMCSLQAANSQSAPATEQLQVPSCLAQNLSIPHQVLAENQDYKIIDLPSSQIDSLVHLSDKRACARFVNVSHKFKASADIHQQAQALLKEPVVKAVQFTPEKYKISHQQEVEAALAKVQEQNIWDILTHLTSYYNRSSRSELGLEVAEWLKTSFEAMVLHYGRNDVETYFVKTGSWYKQPSLVTVIGKDLPGPAVVIGAHMDTLGGRMPGAGDDGSGTSSIMEAARVIFESGVRLERPLYFIWYAAEERGLVGSQYVVQHFQKQHIPVKAVIQFDMTGYRNDQNDPTMWVFKDYTDAKLSDFITDLIETYIKVPVKNSFCGYGCSDHASWMAEGIPAAFPCETSFERHNPYIHSSSDTMDLLSGEHMSNFSKLAVAFAIELAGR